MEQQKAIKRDPPLPKLTDPQIELLTFICEWIDRDPLKRSPTYKQIGMGIGIVHSTAFERVTVLKERGCLSGEPGIQCSLAMTPAGQRAVQAWNTRTRPK